MAIQNRMNSVLLVVMLALISNSAVGDGKSTVWKQDQLNEKYMRSLTKDECMKKTAETLRSGCESEICIKTMGGVIGDCVTWASGDMNSFCRDYDRYIAAYCLSNYLDARRCTLMHVGKTTFCERTKK